MSKTFDVSLITAQARAFWKRFAALGIAYADKYRFDLFFRTETNIIVLQVGFVCLTLAFLWVAFTYAYRDIASTIIIGLQNGLSTASPETAALTLVENLERVRIRNVAIFSGILIFVTAIFGYIVARVTLRPARNALASQKQFIGNIAHELRTPLSVLKTEAEVLLLDEKLEPSVGKALRSGIEELNRISEIINNLLSFTAFIRPERMKFSNVDLGRVLTTARRKLENLSRQKDIAITVRKSEYRVVWGNETALEQIAVNILKNAIIYTRVSGHIAVTIEPDYRGYVELKVEDNGIGIPRKDLFHIFEPFYRAETSRSRSRASGGSGLGLTIVSELVKLHHGKISIRSAFKRGTAVSVFLPSGELSNGKPESSEGTAAPYKLDEVSVDFSKRIT